MRKKTCVLPACQNQELTDMALESSWTVTKCYCIKCGRIYMIPTTVGKASQVAPLLTAGVILTSVLTADYDNAVEHAANLLS